MVVLQGSPLGGERLLPVFQGQGNAFGLREVFCGQERGGSVHGSHVQFVQRFFPQVQVMLQRRVVVPVLVLQKRVPN